MEKRGPSTTSWLRATLKSAIGAPSAGLSLVGLRPRRARLRFTQQQQGNPKAVEAQEQRLHATAPDTEPLNPGGSLLHADVGPFYMPITTTPGFASNLIALLRARWAIQRLARL